MNQICILVELIDLYQENVPGSNEFAEQGANPLFQLAMESADFDDDMKWVYLFTE